MDSNEETPEKSSLDDSSSGNANGIGDDLQWNAEELETQSNASEESGDDGEESDYSSTDSDGFSEKCPICLQRFSGQEIGTPETCEHYFCLECITKWSNKTATCPVDRKSFPSILVRRDLEGEVVRIQEVVFPNQNQNPEGEQYDFDPTYCEICGLCDREDRLLLCDGCDLGYHLECLEPRLEYVPIEDWFCPRCQASHRTPEAAPSSSREASHRSVRVARTSQSIRILHSIARSTTNDLVMETSAMEELAIRRSTASSRNSYRPVQMRRKPIRKARKSKSKSKSAKRKTRSSGRTASEKRPSSIRRRLLQQLRIIPPRPGQVYVGLPNCRGNGNSSTNSASSSTSSLSSQRFHAGITPLRLYDSYDDLESYDNSGDEVPGGEVGVAASVRHRIGLPLRSKFGRAPRDIAPPASLSGRVDILGPILNRQFILHHDRNIHITRDGTLIPFLPVDAAVQFQKQSSKKSDETNNNTIGTRNSNSGASSTSSSPPHNVTNSPDRNSRSPFSSNHGQLPSSIELNEHARQAPSSPNGTSSTNSTAGTSYNNSTSNNTGSARSVPPWESGSNSRNDNDLFSASSNIFPQLCKATGDSKPKSDDESHDKDKTNSKRTQNSKNASDSRHNNDDDEDYNIYSDIEEVPEQEIVVEKKLTRSASQDNESEVEVGRAREDDSDWEMIIDEENAKIRRNSVDAQLLPRPVNNTISLKPIELPATLVLAPGKETMVPKTNTIDHFNVPSPESIPLTDSPPPFDAGEPESPSQPSSLINIRSDILESAGKGKSALREEYDPSQPLDSSDEEEHSMQLTQRHSRSSDEEEEVEKEEEVEIPIPASPPQSVSHVLPKPVREVEDDLNSIPMPPTEDYRRPTIQFSITTRHRLLPISSLIKRQKGVMRKENKNGNPMSFQNEISKIFGDEKGEDGGGEWGKLGDGSEEKLSLVAEIFGSDDEDGEELPVNDARVVGPSNLVEGALNNEEDILKMDSEKLDETAGSSIATVANSRWKTIAEPTLNAAEEAPHTIDSIANSLNKLVEDAVIEDVEERPEIEVVAVKEAEVVVISNLTKVNKLKDQSLL